MFILYVTKQQSSRLLPGMDCLWYFFGVNRNYAMALYNAQITIQESDSRVWLWFNTVQRNKLIMLTHHNSIIWLNLFYSINYWHSTNIFFCIIWSSQNTCFVLDHRLLVLISLHHQNMHYYWTHVNVLSRDLINLNRPINGQLILIQIARKRVPCHGNRRARKDQF